MSDYNDLVGNQAITGAFVAGPDAHWLATHAEKVRQNFYVLSRLGASFSLGGRRGETVTGPAATPIEVPDYWDVLVPWDQLGNMIVRARVEVISDDGTTEVTPEIYLVEVGSTTLAVAGTATDSNTWEEQLLTIPPSSGVKRYRMYLNPGAGGGNVRGLGAIEIYMTR